MGNIPAIFAACFSTPPAYLLSNAVILDSGASIHVFNDRSWFLTYREALPGDFLWAGDTKIPIRGYGEVEITVQGPRGQRNIRLFDAAFCKGIHCNLVSLRELKKQGFWWDTKPKVTLLKRQVDDSVVCYLQEKGSQYVIQLNKSEVIQPAAFPTSTGRKKKITSWTKSQERASKATAWRWHRRMGHPGPQALEHLVNKTKGVKIKGIPTVHCDACAMAKMKRQTKRGPRDLEPIPGRRLAIDFHPFEEDDEKYNTLALITDRYSGYLWDYYLQDRTAGSIKTVIADLVETLERKGFKPLVIEMDNEIWLKREKVTKYLATKKISCEPSTAHTQAQNGAAERSGGIVKEKVNAMRKEARFPTGLWREITRTAVYLLNRTPRWQFGWETPYERFFSESYPQQKKKPNLAHLREFGCKAFVMTTKALTKSDRLKRFEPKAWIGYLIGYEASSIYRIWNPVTNLVVRSRDVSFDEDLSFDGQIISLQDEIKDLGPEELSIRLKSVSITEPQKPGVFPPTRVEADTADEWESGLIPAQEHEWESGLMPAQQGDLVESGDLPAQEEVVDLTQLRPSGEASLDAVAHEETRLLEGGDKDTNQKAENTEVEDDIWSYLNSTVDSPPAALLALTLRAVEEQPIQVDGIKPVKGWKAAFLAGSRYKRLAKVDEKVITKAILGRIMRKGHAGQYLPIYRKDLPPLPKRHRDLEDHSFGEQFEEAEKAHLASHYKMGTWGEIPLATAKRLAKQILDCMWVYTYRFDKKSRLMSVKARLVVRGDQQAKDERETYAATLAARGFRTLLAIAARFDLEMVQFDAVNAFVNSELDEDIYIRLPPGHEKQGLALKLRRALYGLRRSPLLWQKELTSTLKNLGFEQIPDEPCCFIKNGIIIFFYVDDIVFAYRKESSSEAIAAISQLKARYTLTGGGPLQWFLGMEIIRDRGQQLLWISQAQYIEKVAQLVPARTKASHPMPKVEWQPYAGLASARSIHAYQRKIGSILYAAVISRPDIAFAVSRLSRFLVNPGPEHHKAADQVISYLWETRTLALQFGDGDDFQVASDASFADNSLDRKSSQAYAMKLFGGLIGWRSSKQDTVTTSTTEAELLALSQATRESIYVSRLLKSLTVTLDNNKVVVECDNQQTIRLVNAEIAQLKTRLRHVDIHQHWLRQEVQEGRVLVRYTKSAEMIADSLTKALTGAAFEAGRTQLGLVDIAAQIERRRKVEEEMEQKQDEAHRKVMESLLDLPHD